MRTSQYQSPRLVAAVAELSSAALRTKQLLSLRGLFAGMLLLVAWSPLRALAQTDAERITKLESRITGLEYRLSQRMGEGAALFLFAAFCALWAQNTRRNAWLCFFLGLLFSVITVLVLLYKNSQDRRSQT